VPLTEYYGIPADELAAIGSLSAAEGFSPSRTYAYASSGGDNAYVMTNGHVFLRSALPGLDQGSTVPGGVISMTAVSDQGVVGGLTWQALAGMTSSPFLLDVAHPDEPRYLVDIIEHVVGPNVNIDGLRVMDFEPDGDAIVEAAQGVYVLSGDTLTFLRGGDVSRIPGTDDAGRVLTVHVTTSGFTDRSGTFIVTQAQAELLDTDGMRSAVVDLVVDPPEGDHGLNPGHTRHVALGAPLDAISDSLVMLPDGHILTGTHALTPHDATAPYKADHDLHSAAFGASPFVISVNSARMAVGMLQNAAGEWITVGYPELEGASAVDTLTDPKDGVTCVIAFGDLTMPDGAQVAGVVYRVHADGTLADGQVIYTDRNEAIRSKLVSMVSADNRVHVAGLNSHGAFVMFYQTGEGSSDQTWTWAADNISQNHFSPQGLTPPVWASAPTAYATAWGGLNVAVIDDNGRLWSMWWAPGLQLWTTDNLSLITGLAPRIGRDAPAAYVTSWGGINIALASGLDDFEIVWWVPSFGNTWALSNMTDEVGGRLVAPSAYVTPWGGLNVVGTNTDTGRPTVYWWTPATDEWIHEDYDFGGEAVELSADDPRMVPLVRGSELNLLAISADHEVVRMSWAPGDGGVWRLENLSRLASDAQSVLFVDEFNQPGRIDETRWTTPFGSGTGNPGFFGRTALRNWLSAFDQEVLTVDAAGYVVLPLNTYNPYGPGESFYGTEIDTTQLFTVGTGLSFEARVWIDPAMPSGTVASVFAYGIDEETGLHDEIDVELLSKRYLVDDGQVDTNVYADEPLGAGHPRTSDVPGLVLRGEWNTFKTVWHADRVEWYVNGQLVDTRNEFVPQGPVGIRLNIWVAAQEWGDAYDGALQPTADPLADARYEYRVDSVRVTRLVS